jgi:hypothetical protein
MSATELDYRVFTATRPGVNPDVPAGYEGDGSAGPGRLAAWLAAQQPGSGGKVQEP